jgi:type IV secretion system protein VirB10
VKQKKLPKNFVLPIIIGGFAVLLLVQFVKQGGSISDQAYIERQEEEARKEKEKEFAKNVIDPEAQARANLEEAARRAGTNLPPAPQPGAPVPLPDDADAVLEQRKRQLDEAWMALQKNQAGGNSPPATNPNQTSPAGASPGFVGFVKTRKDEPMMAPAPAPSGDTRVNDRMSPADIEKEKARQQADLIRYQDRRATRDANSNWRDDLDAPEKLAKVDQAQRIQGRNSLFAGTIIHAVIEQGIDTALPGPIRARVTHDIYDSRTGQSIVVGRGSMLVGQYRSQVNDGQERVFAVFDRLITPAGAVVSLQQAQAADQMGVTGVPGELHTRFWQRMGIAALLAIEAAFLEKQTGSLNSGIATNGGESKISGSSQILVTTANQELNRRYAIPPNITVPHGAPMNLVLQDNIEIPTGWAR